MSNLQHKFASLFVVGLALAIVSSPQAVFGRGGGGGGGGGGHGGGGGFGGGMSAAHIGGSGPSIGSMRSFSPGNGLQNFSRGPSLGNFSGSSIAGRNVPSLVGRNGPSALNGGSRLGTRNWTAGEQVARSHNNWNNWNGKNWDHHDGHDHDHFFVGGGWPWWLWGWGWGWGGYGDGYGYGYDYPVYYTDQTAAYPNNQYAIDQAPSQADQAGGAAYFAQAEDAFRTCNYRAAFRLANHAAIESPQNPRAPELMSLAMFAQGDYRQAAAFAHAALSLGPPADWATLYGYYGDESAYSSQLRSLEKYTADNPSAADAHFLLGYQYLMCGHTKAALKQFDQVAKIAPDDKLAAELLKKLGGNASGNENAPPPPPVPPQSLQRSGESGPALDLPAPSGGGQEM